MRDSGVTCSRSIRLRISKSTTEWGRRRYGLEVQCYRHHSLETSHQRDATHAATDSQVVAAPAIVTMNQLSPAFATHDALNRIIGGLATDPEDPRQKGHIGFQK